MLCIERANREKYMVCQKVMELDKVKQILYKNTMDHNIAINLEYFTNTKITSLLYEKYSYYLHTLIIFKGHQAVYNFLNLHYKKYGQYATEMLVNYPFISQIDHNIITPLMCAMLWSKEREMIRTLYYWGADVSIQDVRGKYSEEKYGSYYVNHLYAIIAPDYYTLGIRSLKVFLHVIEELKFIAGEDVPPAHWKLPMRAF